MKRILSVVFSVLMIFILSSCSNETIDTPDNKDIASEKSSSAHYEEVQTDTADNSGAAVSAPADSETIDITMYDYADIDIGIACVLGSDWTKADDEDLKKYNQAVNDAFETQAEEVGTYAHNIEYKLIAYRQPQNPLNLEVQGQTSKFFSDSIYVYSEDLSSISGIALSEESYINVCIGDDDSIIQSLGIENGTIKHSEAEIAGQMHASILISGTIDGETYYQFTIVCKPSKFYRYITVFTVTSFGEDNTSEIIHDLFQTIQ